MRLVSFAIDHSSKFSAGGKYHVPILGTTVFVPTIGAMTKTIYSTDNTKLASWLKDTREQKGLTMRDLGGRLQRPHSYVAKIEGRERRLDVVEFVDYCRALEESPVDVLKQVFDLD